MITKKKLLEIAKIHMPFCVSIFIPTHRAGEETLQGKDALALKIQLKKVIQDLEKKGMKKNEIETFVKPITDLIRENEFWRNQSDGLAIFLSENFFQKHTVPVHFEEFNYTSNEFYIKPLIPLFNGDGKFYLLVLQIQGVKFYEGTRHTITEIVIDDLVPSQLEDRVGYDFEENNLQFRSQAGSKKSLVHGHAEADYALKNEILRYFRSIDHGLMQILHENQKSPLLICCVDYLYSIYQEVNTFQNLHPNHLTPHPNDHDPYFLHERAWDLIWPYFDESRQQKTEKFRAEIGTAKAGLDINEIIPACIQGKIDTLFLDNKTEIFGTFDPATQQINVQEEHLPNNVSLTNLAVIKVLDQSGTVYLVDKELMPDDLAPMNAIYRY